MANRCLPLLPQAGRQEPRPWRAEAGVPSSLPYPSAAAEAHTRSREAAGHEQPEGNSICSYSRSQPQGNNPYESSANRLVRTVRNAAIRRKSGRVPNHRPNSKIRRHRISRRRVRRNCIQVPGRPKKYHANAPAMDQSRAHSMDRAGRFRISNTSRNA